MTNLEYCTAILSIIGNVSTPSEAIYNLAYNAYQMIGGQETQPTLETIYNELKAAITVWNDTPNLNVNANGVYTLLGKTVTANVPSVTTMDITQDEYDALQSYDPYKIYLITE